MFSDNFNVHRVSCPESPLSYVLDAALWTVVITGGWDWVGLGSMRLGGFLNSGWYEVWSTFGC